MDPLSGLRTVIGDPAAGWEAAGGEPRPDPLGGGRGEPDLFAASPGAGALELLDHPLPLAELDPEELAAAVATGASGCAPTRMPPTCTCGPTPSALTSMRCRSCRRAIARERERFSAYRERTQGRNLQADLLQAEVRARDRIVSVGPSAVALCPFAPQAPFHVQPMPRAERARFEAEGPHRGGHAA